MPDHGTGTAPTHRVVVDHYGRYSVHPTRRPRPAGWHDAGFEGTEGACLEHLARTWPGPLPTPLRRHPVYRHGGHDTFTALLRGHARQRGGDLACTVLDLHGKEAERATYADLDRRARAVAAVLGSRLSPGDRALVVLPTGVDFVAAFVGCLYAGVIAVPVPYPETTRGAHRRLERLRVLVEDADPAVVLTTTDLADQAESGERTESDGLDGLPRIAVDALDDARAEQWRDPGVKPDTVAFLQYTSGSTSAPKGVVLTHHNLMENLAALAGALRAPDGSGTDGIPAADFCFVSWLPLFHDMGMSQLLVPLFAGGRCVLMPPAAFLLRPALWLEAISHYRGVVAAAPDFAYAMCAQKIPAADIERLDLRSWRHALNGSEPVRWESLRRFTERFAPAGFRESALLPGYGMAEATVYVSGGRGAGGVRVLDVAPEELEREGRVVPAPGDGSRKLVSCGRIPANLDVRIVDRETLRECAADRVGEIWVSGSCVGRGYWRNPEASEARFGGRLAGTDQVFLRTGDLGFLDRGELFIIGRTDDVIIVDGRNVYPQDLEGTATASHPALSKGRCAAFPAPDPDADVPRIVVAVETRARHRVVPPGEQPSSEDDVPAAEITRAVMRGLVEGHQIGVSDVVLLRAGELPRTTSGKVQRKLTRQLYQDGGLKTW